MSVGSIMLMYDTRPRKRFFMQENKNKNEETEMSPFDAKTFCL